MKKKDFKRILVTAALPYANGPLHIGHIAGAYLPADLYCRYQRLKGRDIVFICGSDELGVAIMIRARKEGISPQDLVDRYHPMIEESFQKFGLSFDYYGRTTTVTHLETSQEFFRTLADRDVFTLKTDEQLFDPEAGIFLADRFVRGTCPVCGYDDAYGDQCEKCGSSLSPMELVNPRSALTDATPELRETTHWYLPLGDFQDRLATWIDTHPEWKVNVLGQVKSWLNDGLRDRAITRDVPWGVPVPDDAADKAGIDATGKVIYVWFDAPIGYISATREWGLKKGDSDLWKTYWQDEGTKLVHFIGKDNIVFHCLMFPAMLMAHGDYVLPENVPANEFMNIEGGKLSTSRGWAVWLHESLEEFSPDLLRYSLASMLPETKDSDFSWSEFQVRVNSELADVLGNFVNRTMTFVSRYFGGSVPELVDPSEEDLDALAQIKQSRDKIGSAYEAFRNREAVFETIGLARIGNKYFNDTEPWHTRNSDMKKCGNTIHVCLQICGALSVYMEPVLPFSAEILRRMLMFDGMRSSIPLDEGLPSGSIGWDDAAEPLLKAGQLVGKPEILFQKVEDEVIEAQIEKLNNSVVATAVEEQEPFSPLGEKITFEEFTKLDLRVATITAAARMPKSKKLLRIELDLGFETREVLAGVAEHYESEDLIGKKVVVLANLVPRTMMGVESNGMLLMAEDRDGRLTFVSSNGEDGAVIN